MYRLIPLNPITHKYIHMQTSAFDQYLKCNQINFHEGHAWIKQNILINLFILLRQINETYGLLTVFFCYTEMAFPNISKVIKLINKNSFQHRLDIPQIHCETTTINFSRRNILQFLFFTDTCSVINCSLESKMLSPPFVTHIYILPCFDFFN